jgi:glycogen phosphorylase
MRIYKMDKLRSPLYQIVGVCDRVDIQGYGPLEELALDMHWSWSHMADKIWQKLDPVLWSITHNPWVVLQTVSRERLEKALADPEFRQIVDDIVKAKETQDQTSTWFSQNHPKPSLNAVGYFSMEYMLSEALPIYSGGLGNVAGDQLKAASDLGVPVVAVGLLYQQGYFRQMIDKDGNQEALYPYNDPGQLPITPLRKPNGEWLRLEVAFPGWSVWIRVWQVKVGRVELFLLDSNDAANFPAYRAVTSELYGGGLDLRLKQEILLGIGGWRLLEELGIEPDVCHLNEGHAAFAVLERARRFMEKTGQSFETALASTRAGNLFTTHTAVSAGFDRFPPALIEQYLAHYVGRLGISMHDLLALGRQNPEDAAEPFNMAYLAIQGSGAINGVSLLHGKVSRQIFESFFPRWPQDEVPVGHVTNGVHVPSWDSLQADELWTEMCGKDRWKWAFNCAEKSMETVSNDKLWKMRNISRRSLIGYTRERLARQLAARGSSLEEIEQSKLLFDENTLTLGFARRFATYKRPNMLLHDPERLLRILTHSRFPVQLILAGKAHPADKPGQALIREWMQFIQRPEARPHVIFLSDYDMLLTEKLVHGVDVWINTPRRPWEACGTSGMKVLVNGGLNLSELDGWWAEAYCPEVGWALGDGKEHGDDPSWDAAEANALYNLLENEVVPTFYNRDAEGMPHAWITKMRVSMARLTPYYSASRTVRDYTEHYYLPAAKNYQMRASNQGLKGIEIVKWKHALAQNWSKIRIGDVKVELKQDQYQFEVQVYLNGLDPNAIKVELYAEKSGDNASIHQEMKRLRQLSGDENTYVYSTLVTASHPEGAYTPRVIPYFPDVAVPLEANHILWQK